ncbi:MAG TPA: hypothetical protein GX506_04630 [Firmicutes bacterium]|nr:hypothetical protein [Bacillota bacterium]
MVRRRLLSLILAQLNMNFAISHSRYYYLKKRERLWEPILIAVSIGILAALLAFGVFRISSAYYDAVAAIGQGDLTLILGILLSQLVVLILGFVLVIAVFYFSNDLSILIPLPLSPAEVLACKFSVILSNEYVGLSVILVPLFIAYALKAGVSPVAYTASAILVFLALPVIPLTIAAVPAILLMRVANLSRRKDVLVMIGGFLFIIIIVVFQFFVQTRLPGPGEENEFIRRVLSAANSLVSLVGRQFPPSIWATRALGSAGTLPGFLYLILFLGVSALSLAVLFGIGNKAFYEGVVSGFEAADATRKKLLAGQFPALRFHQRSPARALALTEVRLFTRTPVFVLNGFTGFVMFPVMFIIVFLVGRVGESGLKDLWSLISSLPDIRAAGALVVGAYFLVSAAFSSIPFTPFSREGVRNIWIPMSMPVSGRTISLAKALGAEWMITLGSLPGVAVLEYLLRLPVGYLLSGVAIGVMISFAFCLWGCIVDMARPMLNWTDQQKAIKSNLNTALGMLAGIVVTAILGLVAKIVFATGIPGWAVVTGMGVIVTGILGLSLNLTGAIADRIWCRRHRI